MTVCLDETVTITETTYKISVETYNEIQEIAQEFEDSLRRALVPLHADDNYPDDDEEATVEPVEAEETLVLPNRFRVLDIVLLVRVTRQQESQVSAQLGKFID